MTDDSATKRRKQRRVKSLRGMIVIGAALAMAGGSGVVASLASHVMGGSTGF